MYTEQGIQRSPGHQETLIFEWVKEEECFQNRNRDQGEQNISEFYEKPFLLPETQKLLSQRFHGWAYEEAFEETSKISNVSAMFPRLPRA